MRATLHLMTAPKNAGNVNRPGLSVVNWFVQLPLVLETCEFASSKLSKWCDVEIPTNLGLSQMVRFSVSIHDMNSVKNDCILQLHKSYLSYSRVVL